MTFTGCMAHSLTRAPSGCPTCAYLRELERERDEARANYRLMVERAADKDGKLDGYRELGARAAAAEAARDAALAEVRDLRQALLAVRTLAGDAVEESAPPAPAPVEAPVERSVVCRICGDGDPYPWGPPCVGPHRYAPRSPAPAPAPDPALDQVDEAGGSTDLDRRKP
jgi:hypothetical protein